MLRRWQALRRRPPAHLRLLGRAAWLLAWTRVTLWLLPFARVRGGVSRLAQRQWGAGPVVETDAVGWAVSRASVLVPGSSCLSRALVGHVMLARGGTASTLRLGVAGGGGREFEAHAWLETAEGSVVIGAEVAGEFVAFPQPPALPGDARPSQALRILLDAGREGWSAAAVQAFRDLDVTGDEWSATRRTAARHRVTPLLWRALQAAPTGLVPAATLEDVRAEYHAIAARSLELTGLTVDLLERLEGAGVPAIPYKGAAMAVALYGSPAMRQYRDVDVLVHRDDVLAARESLREAGFSELHPTTGAAWQVLARSNHEVTMTRGAVVVELHWGVAPVQLGVTVDVPGLFSRSRPGEVGGRQVRMLSAEDLLVLLCVHGARDRWQWLDNVCAVDQLARAANLDWHQAVEVAEQVNAGRMLRVGLALAASTLGTPLPRWLAARVGEDHAAKTLAAMSPASRVTEALPDPSAEGLRQVGYHLRMQEGPRDRARYLARVAFTPNVVDCELVALPERLAFLYYGVHLYRVARSYAPGLRRKGPLPG